MAKKKVVYDLFARIVVPETVDENAIVTQLQNACSQKGWNFSANIEEEGEDSLRPEIFDYEQDNEDTDG